MRDALTNAPAVFIATVRTILQMEKERNRASQEIPPPNAGLPFSILRDLEGCWDNERLKAALFEEVQAANVRPAEYAALLDALLEAGYEPAIADAVTRIGVLDESTLMIADVILRQVPARVWPMLWPKLVESDDLARAVLTRIAGSFYYNTSFYAGIGADATADLYLIMERLFPSEPDPKLLSGFVGPLDMLRSLRDGAPRYLAEAGTEEAVRALRRLAGERPDLPLLPFELSRGELAMRLRTWSPLTMQEIFALTDRPDAGLVTSAGDLIEVLLETLAKFEVELHGAQTPVRGLWDRQPGDQGWRPIEEDGLSNAVTIYLRQELARAGIFANREVEVVRRVGAPIGRRTDILINTNRRTDDGQLFDPITAVIETKGCWNSELYTAIDAQLVGDYMVNLSAPVGIYLVGWFDKALWDKTDSRRGRVPDTPISELQSLLTQQAAATPEGFYVRAVVLDIKVPGA